MLLVQLILQIFPTACEWHTSYEDLNHDSMLVSSIHLSYLLPSDVGVGDLKDGFIDVHPTMGMILMKKCHRILWIQLVSLSLFVILIIMK